MIKFQIQGIFLISILFLFACKGEDENKTNTIDLVRFDRLLMELDTNDVEGAFTRLQQKYPDFTDKYFDNVLPLSAYRTDKDSFLFHLKEFIRDESMIKLSGLINEQYPDFEPEMFAFEKAFQNAKTWFPDLETPRIYTFLSEFSLQRFIFLDGQKDGLAIGLDLFLGEDFDYSQLETGSNLFSNYLTRSYNKDHLVKKTMEAWLEDRLGENNGNRLIDKMMHNGKKMYLLKQILDVQDSVLLEYSSEQVEWIEQNEKEMWTFYIKNDWFYTMDQYIIKRLVFPSPNTTAIGMPAAAPGQTGNYLGWRIVENYMKRNPETSTEELLNMEGQRLLELSKFKPRSQ